MASARGTLLISTYRFATWAATPFARLLLSSRLKRGKEDAARLNERFGQAKAPRPKGRWCGCTAPVSARCSRCCR